MVELPISQGDSNFKVYSIKKIVERFRNPPENY